jgi:hypothetical protein
MAGLDPAIHEAAQHLNVDVRHRPWRLIMDARVKPAHDKSENWTPLARA